VKPTRRTSAPVSVVAVGAGGRARRQDAVVTEEPLQLRAHGPGQPPRDVVVTMRTPGHDFELAVGHLAGLGVVRTRDDVREVRYCDVAVGEPQLYNVVTVATRAPLAEALFSRVAPATASCGICGVTSIDEVRVAVEPRPSIEPIPADVLVGLPDQLRAAQAVFDRTGAVHAAGRFRRDGTVVVVREDVGRHNAVDKVVGWSILTGPAVAPDDVLVLSGRVSFELVQKAAAAGFAAIVAVSGPSSLAVQLAEELGVAVLGFTRAGAANVYAHPEHVAG
jgi:FdhD protein